ncbi:MAG: hypothetical protein OEY03_09070 [Rhizobacter sp.]|nr:hypothetical protein [Rhizobacter sp.]
MSYGPNPWQQAHWDWRAAANFVSGGAGSGLIVVCVVTGASGPLPSALLATGAALIGFGLLCVWGEIGRPWRALNVLFNPRTSWMTREAIVATLLLPATLAAAAGAGNLRWPVAALALGFLFCQARILRAARGIPAWREPWIVPLIVSTGLAEGAGLWLAAQAAFGVAQPQMLVPVALVWLARTPAYATYRRRLAPHAAAPALGALDPAGRRLLTAGGTLPLATLALVAVGLLGGAPASALLVAAGLAAAGTGGWFKFVLVTRAAFNQGFALTHLPVRGAHR